jgi:hypothetical protein
MGGMDIGVRGRGIYLFFHVQNPTNFIFIQYLLHFGKNLFNAIVISALVNPGSGVLKVNIYRIKKLFINQNAP